MEVMAIPPTTKGVGILAIFFMSSSVVLIDSLGGWREAITYTAAIVFSYLMGWLSCQIISKNQEKPTQEIIK